MSDDKSKDRVSVRTILDREGLNRTDGDKGMSETAVATGLAGLGKQSKGAFLGIMMGSKALGEGLGLSSRKGVSRVFREPYPTVLRALVVVMAGGSTGLTLAVDTRRGAYLKGTLPSDMLSGAGEVEFDVQDLGDAGVEIIGKSKIKGQMFAWGKGRRALNAVLDEATDMVRRF